MEKILGLVHTTRLVVERSHVAITTELPDYKPVHLLDETLLMDFCPDEVSMLRRAASAMVRSAEEAEAAMALITCSSLGDAVYEVGVR